MDKANLKIAILTPSVSRLAGGLFYSVRGPLPHLTNSVDIKVISQIDSYTKEDIQYWSKFRVSLIKKNFFNLIVTNSQVEYEIKNNNIDIGIGRAHV